MIFLQSNNVEANNPFGEITITPLIVAPFSRTGFSHPTVDDLNQIAHDCIFPSESPQLDELRKIINHEFMACLNPFDTVAVSRKAIALLDAYKHIRQAEATQLFSFNSNPHAVVNRYDFYTSLSKSISR